MTFPTQLFVDGGFRDSTSGNRTTLVNPATGEPFGEVAAGGVEDVNGAAESAFQAWETVWRDMKPGKRAEILYSVARVLRENIEMIARLESLQIGKPISDARD